MCLSIGLFIVKTYAFVFVCGFSCCLFAEFLHLFACRVSHKIAHICTVMTVR